MQSVLEFSSTKPVLLSKLGPEGLSDPPRARRVDSRPVVLVVDDHCAECECIANALGARCPEFRVLAHVSGKLGSVAVEPSVILANVATDGLPRSAFADRIRAIQTWMPGVPIVVLADDDCGMNASADLIQFGVSGCLSHSVGIEGLTKVLWLVLHGGVCFPRNSIRIPQVRAPAQATPEPNLSANIEQGAQECAAEFGLTCRENEVVGLLRLGKPNKIIAYELGISISTVKVHIRNIMRKTGATNRVEAALIPQKA